MDFISHFSHRHKLRLGSRKTESERCKLCNEWIYEPNDGYECYSCTERCLFSIHKVCAEFSEKQRHPFHPHHTLVLRGTQEGDRNRWFKCSLCRQSSQTFGYFCKECNFVLDTRCAALTPIETQAPNIHHQHPVFMCEKPKVYYFQYSCQLCGEKLEHNDHICVCIECKNLLHEICASLPNEIRHPFHLQHPLTIHEPKDLGTMRNCNACSGGLRGYGHKFYQCSVCFFTLDVHCASLIPTVRNGDLNQKDLTKVISGSHSHPLIQCDNILNFRRRCYGCTHPFEDFIYVCLDCSILLNKSCVDLPADITNPLHPQHRLVLGRSWGCRGCQKHAGNFSYSCRECKFVLDLKCATKLFQFVKFELHKHALAYFDFEAKGDKCHKCPRMCSKYFFRCVECYFSIHDHCCPLPRTIKHSCHCDPLNFTYSVIKDVPDEDEFRGEFYCHACEERRELYHPTYYCAECHFIAHVHCVISEIISYFQREALALADKFGKTKLENVGRGGKTLEAEATSGSRRDYAFIEFEDDQHKNKDDVHQKPNEDHVQEQNKEDVEEDDEFEYGAQDEKIISGESVQKEDQDKTANKDNVIQRIDERIDALKAEIAKLQETRAQHIAQKK